MSPTESGWTELLAPLPHDIFHTASYHQHSMLSSVNSVGRTRAFGEQDADQHAFLFHYAQDGQEFAYPYILRKLSGIDGLESCDRYDVTSVYGYAGPVASHGVSADFLTAAWRELLSIWKEQQVVSAFTRFHPILENQKFVPSESIPALQQKSPYAAATGVVCCGPTVSLDLRLGAEKNFSQYDKELRRTIKRAYELGFKVLDVPPFEIIDDFLALYTATMDRKSALNQYAIDRDSLLRLIRTIPECCHFLVAELQGQLTAAMLVLEYKGVVSAFLAGVSDAHREYSPLKPLLDGTRLWATQRGNSWFHLGGGLGGRPDSLFHFKAKFSPVRRQFHIGCWIIDPEQYSTLCEMRRHLHSLQHPDCRYQESFPEYRARLLTTAELTCS